MGTAERRNEIMRILCRRRYETIFNLANEFGVSQRTILRDIDVLSLSEPIYTQCGRYGGGVYVNKDYKMERMYMTSKELEVLQKLKLFAESEESCKLSRAERKTLSSIISQYTKPTN